MGPPVAREDLRGPSMPVAPSCFVAENLRGALNELVSTLRVYELTFVLLV